MGTGLWGRWAISGSQGPLALTAPLETDRWTPTGWGHVPSGAGGRDQGRLSRGVDPLLQTPFSITSPGPWRTEGRGRRRTPSHLLRAFEAVGSLRGPGLIKELWGRPCCQGHPSPPAADSSGREATPPLTSLVWSSPQLLSRGGQPEESYLFYLFIQICWGGGGRWLLPPSLPSAEQPQGASGGAPSPFPVKLTSCPWALACPWCYRLLKASSSLGSGGPWEVLYRPLIKTSA